jgi:hypothetical protein
MVTLADAVAGGRWTVLVQKVGLRRRIHDNMDAEVAAQKVDCVAVSKASDMTVVMALLFGRVDGEE